MTDKLDLIVIGAGMAGITAAKKCSNAGWSVAVVDELPYGGTCALRGCDPKKMLRAGAEAMEAAQRLSGKGIAGETRIDWPALMKHKESFTDPVPQSMESGLKEAGVRTFHGRTRFTAEDRIEIEDQGEIAFRHALIATGAKPRPLEFPGAEKLIDSTDFLNLAELPRRIVFVGGGYISFEFAHIAARAGAQVTILDRGARQLKMFDPDLVDMLLDRSRSAGIEIIDEAAIERVENADGAHRVVYRKADGTDTMEADLVVHGAGRVPSVDHLELGAAGIATEQGGVKVTPWLQSPSNSRIFAAGDAAASPGKPLTPVAVFEGKIAASNMLKDKRTEPDYTGVPSVVFTIPELARVGMLEEEARARGDVEVRLTDTSGWFSQKRLGESHAGAKVITAKDGKILGAHMFGPDYAELINVFSLAIKLGLTAAQVKAMPAAYPTGASDIGSMF
ncbi:MULTISPECIES: NAD(P)/FAD-dependent oxidoreductase [unclassified Thioclava]|uniref:dihydrolipoyl dehydrogenase family protein n=1 Tax=unclassified Thioclava TaxID=2621713 RepID=UPI000996D855|nr:MULTISPECIES: NAD(P)/FAD-dependent oxidoreductase [unclassified Thioclava]OOY14451.1 pyridine nucleotide-disulfide oxidoreductase [Thioclava sp. DLFJ4-1]OWY06955.1 pyridine nucleotide-disulfide oxidoreductase [Thioclava sp. IC9]OWY10430.1 pyridine nucleotide-disulfide oxidoreductase [Thioclava sp. JM3]